MSYLINTYWNPIVNAGTEHPIHLTLIYPILITLEYPILMTLEHPILITLEYPILITLEHPVLMTLKHPILITLEHPVLMILEVGKNTELFLNDQTFSDNSTKINNSTWNSLNYIKLSTCET